MTKEEFHPLMKGKLINNISGNFVRLIFTSLINLASLSLIARHLNPELVGVYLYSIVLPFLLIALLNFGVPSSIIFHCSRGILSVNDAFKEAFFYSVICTLVGLTLGTCLITFGAFADNGVNVIFLCLAAFPFMLINLFVQGIFQAFEMFREYNICMMLQPLCFFIGMASLLFLGPEDVFFAGVNFFASHALTALLSVAWVLAKKNLMPEHPTKASFEKRLRYGLNTYAGNLLAFLNYRSDIYILGLFVAPISIGFYSVAVQIAEKFWLLSSAVGTVFFPFLSRQKAEGVESSRTLARALRSVFAFNVLAAMAFIIFGERFVIALLGEDFAVVFGVILVLLPGIVASSLSKIIAVEFSASGRPDLNYKVSAFVLIFNIICNILLIPSYGYIAAVYVCSVSYLLNFTIKLVIYRMAISPVRLVDFFVLRVSDIRAIRDTLYALTNRRV